MGGIGATSCKSYLMNREPGQLHIGEAINSNGDRSGDPISIESSDLTTHGVIVGMTGSGKTGLGVVMLEEALLSGVPVLAIDPKGDLANLCLTFPNLATSDFEPWVDQTKAASDGKTVTEVATSTAELWKNGLASWDLDGASIERLQSAASPIVYTPGSDAGVPLDILGRLSKPASDDPAVLQDEVESTVSGLLGLIGVESDPLSGREHILLSNLITNAWNNETEMDLATLLQQLLDPPIRKLGVLELDAFFPAKDRQALVMKLNGLLASPSFAAWTQGAPLDIEKMLWDENGNGRAAIVSLNHLEESERHFAVTVILSKLISWMRTQQGTGGLRAMVYLDEVMGFAPPNGNPPPKKPILTILKQARAFGVGMILSTQNPVDLDYKAISNAGTWLIGRLQTEQDKNRLVDGLRSADGEVDIAELSDTISGLGKRQFVLRTTRSSSLPLFTTRWAMSYLAGPLTRTQLSTLMADKKSTVASTATMPAQSDETADSAPPIGDDESPTAPKWPTSIDVRFAATSSPWLDAVGADANGKRLMPALAARVSLLFDETKADLRHQQEWEAIIPLVDSIIDVDNAIAVDFDDRDLVTEAPDASVYALGHNDVTAAELKKAQTAIKNELYTTQTITLLKNSTLKLWSRPGESADDFNLRCDAAAQDKADAETAKIRTRLEKKMGTVQTALAKAEDRVHELQIQAEGRRENQMVNVATSVLGGLLGGRSRTRGMASAARRVSSGRRQAAASQARTETAQNRVLEKTEQLEDLELELQEAIIEIDDKWNDAASDIEPQDIALEKSDITITDFVAVWLPTSR